MSEHPPNTESLETLRLLYPIFKEEVYRRRAAMAQMSRRGIFAFTTLSILSLFIPENSPSPPIFKFLCAGSVALAMLLLIFQLIQEKSRHEKAKLQLIRLERGFGFFEEGRYLPKEQLYPSEWTQRPNFDQDLVVSIVALVTSGLILMMLLLRV